MRGIVFVSVALLLLAHCGPSPEPSPSFPCALWKGGRCACDGGVWGVEVCATLDAGVSVVCRCQ